MDVHHLAAARQNRINILPRPVIGKAESLSFLRGQRHDLGANIVDFLYRLAGVHAVQGRRVAGGNVMGRQRGTCAERKGKKQKQYLFHEKPHS